MSLRQGPSTRRAALAEAARCRLSLRSPLWWALFLRIFTATLRGHFNAVRLSRAGASPPKLRPLVIYSNHPSWWDACVYVILVARLFPGRILRAPMDARMLAKYGFMPKIGIFGLEQDDATGGALFLAICRQIFASPRDLLMVTAQGRFADPRERPLDLSPGIAHLPGLAPGLSLVPLAIDYPFWSEKRGEILLRFGAPLNGDMLASCSVRERRQLLENALTETMDALAAEAIARDPSAFDVVLTGRRGVNPVFDVARRFMAILRGRAFDAGHGEALR